MAQYTVRVYFQTGFNSVNIPDGPGLLNGDEQTVLPTTEFSYLDFPSLDLNQERFLPLVRIRTSWDVIKNADYCRIGDWYYFVNGIRMSSGDVAELSLAPDFLTSLGGVSQLVILDGVTERVHVTDDTFGKYASEDPYMAPAYDMDVQAMTHRFTGDPVTFVETTLNLQGLGRASLDGDLTASIARTTELDGDGNPYTVTYPTVPKLPQGTKYSTELLAGSFDLIDTKSQGLFEVTDDTQIYDDWVREGIAQARSLGIEEAISGQFSIPSDFVSLSKNQRFILRSTGQKGVVSITDLPFIFGTARNNRIFYGGYTPYTLATAAGNTVTAKAEEIYTGGAAPQVFYTADPRRTGKPYFRFTPMNSISADGWDLFRNCAAGQQWNSVPLVMTNKSGSFLDQVAFDASQLRRDMAEKFAQQKYYEEEAKNQMGAVGDVVQNTLDFKLGSAVTSAVSRGTADFDRQNEYNRYRRQSQQERALEEQSFGISQNVYVPSIRFPVDPALFSELTGNGFSVYRTVYKAADIARIDKILTAFGYKHTKLLEPSDFTNRRDFNYVKASVSIGNIPRWWANGIAAQLSGGVRVWHKRPNPAYYTQNPVAV